MPCQRPIKRHQLNKMKLLTLLTLLTVMFSNTMAQESCYKKLTSIATEITTFPYISDKFVFNKTNFLEQTVDRISYRCFDEIFKYSFGNVMYTFKDTLNNVYPLNGLKKFQFNGYTGFVSHNEISCLPKGIIGFQDFAFFDTIGKLVYATSISDYRFNFETNQFSKYYSYIINDTYIVIFEHSNSPKYSSIAKIIQYDNSDESNPIFSTEYNASDGKNVDSVLKEVYIKKINLKYKSPNIVNLDNQFFEDALGYIPSEMFNLEHTFLLHSWETKVNRDSVKGYLIARYKILKAKNKDVSYLNIFVNNLNMSGFTSSIEVYGAEEDSVGVTHTTYTIAQYLKGGDLKHVITGKLNVIANKLTITNSDMENRQYYLQKD
jgi:hypothetical protein